MEKSKNRKINEEQGTYLAESLYGTSWAISLKMYFISYDGMQMQKAKGPLINTWY